MSATHGGDAAEHALHGRVLLGLAQQLRQLPVPRKAPALELGEHQLPIGDDLEGATSSGNQLHLTVLERGLEFDGQTGRLRFEASLDAVLDADLHRHPLA